MSNSSRPRSALGWLHSWLSSADTPRPSDLIFVLAGRVARKEHALELLREKFAPRILFSVARFEIRRFSQLPLPVSLDLLKLAQELPPPQRHYFVFFEGQDVQVEHVPPRRFGTLNEVKAFGRWLARRPAVRSALVVSSDTHLRRIRMCCRSLLPRSVDLSFVAVPVGKDPSSARDSARLDLQELMKVLVYSVLLRFRAK